MITKHEHAVTVVVNKKARVVALSSQANVEPISLREAARRPQVRASAVQKRVKAGTVFALAGGKLDWKTVERE